MLQIHKFIFNPFQQNTFLVWDQSGNCAIIDPGCFTQEEKESLAAYVEKNGLKPQMILLTHAHLDHILGVPFCMQKYGIPVYMDPKEVQTMEGFNPRLGAYGLPDIPPFPFTGVKDGDLLNLGQSAIRVLSTPGHSMGGLCWWFEAENIIFTGDTLFAGSIGRTDNEYADWGTLINSIKQTLMSLEGDVDVYPGHGPATSIGNERLMNPFIMDQFGQDGYQQM